MSETTGTPKEDLLRVYETFASTGAPDKAGTIMYAMGWTQKSVGVQNIRAMSIIQLLLGNIGVAGGGVNALRGESNVQGSTDQALLADIWPGYLPVPTSTLTTLADYNATTPKTNDPKSVNWWGNRPKYTASFLMSLYPGVTPDVAYSYVPRLDADKKRTDYMWMSIFDRMVEGKLDGLFAWGMNPACSGPNANKSRGAMEKLKWLVNVNLFDNETGSFWRGPGKDPTQIATEVFFLPCCTSIEKEGSIANSGRWMQWRYAGPDRYGETKPDGDIMVEMMLAIRKLYKEQGRRLPRTNPWPRHRQVDGRARVLARQHRQGHERLLPARRDHRRQAVQGRASGPRLRHAAGRRLHRQRQLAARGLVDGRGQYDGPPRQNADA